MNSKKSILFLSALDFKEKSIQVIRKTPEAYISAGWDVYYIVIRDDSKYGNYFYENKIDITGLKLFRASLPFQYFIDKFGRNKIIRRILQKFSYFFAIIRIFLIARKTLKISKIDVIYGYEIHGVLAVNLLKFFGYLNSKRIISRFQGTFYSFYFLDNKQYSKMLVNLEHYLALYLPSDLCIMTNDGTQGNKLLTLIGSKNLSNYKFWPNGVDEQKVDKQLSTEFKKRLNLKNDLIFLTVSRLERWKRVDRGIEVLNILKKKYGISNFKYIIVGEGIEKENMNILARQYGLQDNILFTGAIPNYKVKNYLNIADFFILTNDASNVGNPLLEAIRSNKIIFTLDTGDTRSWIEHKKNGFIYKIEENLFDKMAMDMKDLISDPELKHHILKNVKATEKEKLWTWEARMNAEISEVESLLI